MKDEFNYDAVPNGYTHCFNTLCRKGEKCLHRLVAVHSTNQYSTLTVVNPKCIPEDGTGSTCFKPIQKIHVAWGIKNLLDDVPHKDAITIKDHLLSYFGRSLYYRLYRKEQFIDPKQQDYIRRLFLQKGITKEPVYEYYTEEYKW